MQYSKKDCNPMTIFYKKINSKTRISKKIEQTKFLSQITIRVEQNDKKASKEWYNLALV